MELIFLIPIICSLIVTFIILPFWIKRAKKAGIHGKDVHKKGNVIVSEMGGIAVVAATVFGVIVLIAIETFIFQNEILNIQLMAALVTLLTVALIGIVDDILGWKIGLRQSHKPILVLLAALPLVAISAGESTMSLPFLGRVSIGLLYPLFVVPIAITGASNGFNMLAGYNGLEAGMGVIILTTLSLITFPIGFPIAGILGLIMVAALIAFLYYNWYPAKIFPGDTLTYSVGAMIAIVAILGNVERIALFLFIPYYLEFLFKIRGRFRKESFAKVLKDGTLGQPYEKFYGLEHIAINLLKKIKGKATEKSVVLMLYTFQLLLVVVAMFVPL